MAGIDGIKKKIEPLTPSTRTLRAPPDEAANIPQAPTSLSAVIDRFEEDHEYLTEGGVHRGPDRTYIRPSGRMRSSRSRSGLTPTNSRSITT
jgi:hypothetical protein